MLKKISIGGYVTCVAAILTLVSLIIYGLNVSGKGYFQHASVTGLVLWTVCALVLYVAAICLQQAQIKAVPKVCIDILSGLMQIAAPALVALALINLIGGRVEGLGFIFFSNADVTLEVQTPANLASAHGAIASMIGFGISMIAGMVAAFFRLEKKEN